MEVLSQIEEISFKNGSCSYGVLEDYIVCGFDNMIDIVCVEFSYILGHSIKLNSVQIIVACS